MESYLVTISKADAKLKQLSDFTRGIFIDNSGSTVSRLASAGKSILEVELSICQAIRFDEVVLWNSDARLCTDIESATPRGGTSPASIFRTESTENVFNASDVIVFVTDGEIEQSSVTQFAKATQDNLNKALIICIIVSHKLADPRQINVSVIAPLTFSSNVLCLYHDGVTFYILSSKGHISQFYPASNDFTTYEKFKTVNLRALFEHLQLYECQKIPDGYIPIREDEKEIVAIDLNRMFASPDAETIWKLTENDWKTLIKYGKIGGRLHDVRTFVTSMKYQAIQREKDLGRDKFDFRHSHQRDEIVARIVQLKFQEDGDHSDELAELRAELSQVSDRAKLEEIEYNEYINKDLHQTRAHWNSIQALIHVQEQGSYSIDDFNFTSNRANRAKVLSVGDDDDDDEQSGSFRILDHTDVPLIECAICMKEGPYVLWLREPKDLEDSTNDFIITFPLSGNEQLGHCLVSNPVCGNCAQSFIAASEKSGSGLLTLYRESCSGFVPAKWSSASNRRFASHALYRILTGRRILHHVQMLLWALIDDCQASWFPTTVKEYFIREIAENLFTADSFSDEGVRMKFIDALKKIVKQTDALLRQPFRAVCRILRWSSIFHQLGREAIVALLRNRFALLCIESFCSKTKHGSEPLDHAKQDLRETIFDTMCGIPMQGSFKPIYIRDDRFKRFLGNSFEDFIQSVDRLSKHTGTGPSAILPGVIVPSVLYFLTTISVHDRPMKLYTEFARQHQHMRGPMRIEWSSLEQQVNQTVFAHCVTPLDYVIPAYAINLGAHSSPSKFFFRDVPLWSKEVENTRINLTLLMNQVKVNLDAKLREYYGVCVPKRSSGHFPVHTTVAQVIESGYPNDDEINERMVLDCLMHIVRTAGRKGNIYDPNVFQCVVLVIEDYLIFRRSTQNMSVAGREYLSRSYYHKVLAELVASGMVYDYAMDVVLFEPAKLKVPRVIRLGNSQKDLHELRKRVEELYRMSRQAASVNPNSTCFNIEIKEFIEFVYKMNPIHLPPMWSQEQKNVVSSIVTDTDQIQQPVTYVAGLDISFVKDDEKAVASMVIFDYRTLTIVAKISVNCKMKIPYIAGYLPFREAPVFMKLLDIQKEHCPHLTPQVILMDGNGIWHPRRAGIASHFGVLSGIPCFGVSKSVLYADGVTREKVEELLTKEALEEHQHAEVIGDSGAVLGLAYNITGSIRNAVYISAGHRITLKTACEIFQSVTKYRICEPIWQANLLSREMVAKMT